jgi:lycopene beta-cyclase
MDVVVGFGLAGTTLAPHLADRPLWVIDPLAPEDDLRTFGTWAVGPHPMDAVAYRSWDRLCMHADGLIEVPLAPYRYLAFRMGDWRTQVARRLVRARFVREVVRDVTDSPYGATVHLDGESISARFVYDSRFSPSALRPGPGETLLWQSFHGARVCAAHDVFDPDRPILMDFRAAGPGLVFGYVLPEDPRRALVELVSIGPSPSRVDLDAYLRDVLGVRSWTVEVEEGGVTPMTDAPFPRRHGNRVLAVGIAGGRLKPSTGYGIGRMLRDAAAIADSLRRQGHPFELPPDGALFGGSGAAAGAARRPRARAEDLRRVVPRQPRTPRARIPGRTGLAGGDRGAGGQLAAAALPARAPSARVVTRERRSKLTPPGASRAPRRRSRTPGPTGRQRPAAPGRPSPADRTPRTPAPRRAGTAPVHAGCASRQSPAGDR